MKVTASILLFCFWFLAAQPLAAMVKSQLDKEEGKCAMSCCQKHKQAPKKAPVNNCCNDLCNPFGQYSCCMGFVVEKEPSVTAVKEIKQKLIPISVSGFVQQNLSDCWRPPEGIVS